MKKILIIGASILQLPAILKAKEAGLCVGVADFNPEAVGIAFADKYYNVSTIDEEGIYEAAKDFGADGIATLATDMPMRALAYACSRLNLPGISYDTAVKSTDKGEMIKAFEKNGTAHPWYFIINSSEELQAIKDKLKYPCISKPTDNSGSRGVMVSESFEELEKALSYSSENGRSGAVIIEELLRGNEISVEVIVSSGVPHIIQITDKTTTGAPHFVETGHLQPCNADSGTCEKVRALAENAVRAVGIENGAAHVEMMITADGPKMIELGARLGGDCITTHLVPLSTGIDMVKAVIDISLGEKPDLTPTKNKCSGIRFLSGRPGIIKEIKGKEKALATENTVAVEFMKKPGDIVSEISSSNDREGYVIAEADTREQVIKALEKAAEAVEIVTEKQKKVLFLGGFPQMCDIVETAKKMGIFTVVADRDPDSPAKKLADKSYDLSTDNIPALVKLCREEGIDGVFNGFEDFNIHIAEKLCRELKLPFYADEKILELVTDKNEFKKQCIKYGIETVPQYTFEEALRAEAYPYIVKPADSYGSRGITVCRKKEELENACIKAEGSSASKTYIIEKFIESDCGTELFYTAVNGHIHLSATADRYTAETGRNSVPLPAAEVFPSQSREEVIARLDEKFRKMLSGTGIKNGPVLIQMLNDNGNFYPYEMAFRLTGEQHYEFLREQNGFDIGEMMIKLCLGEDISDYDSEKADEKSFLKPCANLAVMLSPGKIGRISGLDALDREPAVISYIVTHKENDVIEERGDYSLLLVRINLAAESRRELSELIDRLQKSITVLSDDNKNMIKSVFRL